MHCHICKFTALGAVLFVTEASKAKGAEPDLERPVARDENVETEVKLLGADQKRLVNIATDDIRLLLTRLLVILIVCPFLNLFEFIDQEDALALCGIRRFHDPRRVRIALEFFDEYRVVARKHVRHRHHVHVHVVARRVLLGYRIVFLLHFLAPSFDVLYHEILPRQLEMVREMIYKSE